MLLWMTKFHSFLTDTVFHCIYHIFFFRSSSSSSSSWYHVNLQFSQFSHSLVSDSVQPHGLQHTRLPCPSPTAWDCSNSCPSNRRCHPTISSSVVTFSCFLSFPASGSSQMNQFFISGGQSIGVSASTSVLPMNTQTDFLQDQLVWSPCNPRNSQ